MSRQIQAFLPVREGVSLTNNGPAKSTPVLAKGRDSWTQKDGSGGGVAVVVDKALLDVCSTLHIEK